VKLERGASSADAPALLVLFFVNVLNYYDRQALGALVEPLRHEFRLSDTQLAAIPTLVTIVYAVAGVPLGRLADRVNRKRLLAAGVAVWAALTGFGALASGYAMLLVSRLGMGAGEAVCAPAATSWIGDLVPASRRARAMAGFMMAVPVGIMLSSAIGGPVAQAHGWRMALVLAAIPGLVLVPAVLWLREPERPPLPAAGGGVAALPGVFWWIAVSGAVVNFALYSFSTFLPAFLTRYHGMSVAQAGIWTGIGSGVCRQRGHRNCAGKRLGLAGFAAFRRSGPTAGRRHGHPAARIGTDACIAKRRCRTRRGEGRASAADRHSVGRRLPARQA